MKLERTKNTARNMIFGSISKVYNLAVPFVLRTIMIYTLGMQYVGLNSVFTSVLQVLNLAELGVGSAMIYSMYKPLAEGDTVKIGALMNLYKVYYRIIGAFILVAGLALMPFIPNLISGEIPDDMNIYILYGINLGATVLSYWLFAYKNCLLFVHQRNDITEKISMIINTIRYVLQIGALIIFKNYYIFIIITLVTGAALNIVTALVVDKLYPQYKAIGKLEKSEIKLINGRVRDLVTGKIGYIIVEQSDTLIISAFLGLTLLAQYQNYYFILTSIMGFVMIIANSARAGIGNSLVTETAEKNFNDLKKFTLIFVWMGIFCTCCFACLYQPFMELWVGEENLLDYSLAILFSVYFFVKLMNQLYIMYKDAAGIWNYDRFRPLAVAVANLVMNLIMVQFWGLYGILLSTILSTLVVGFPWLFYNLFKWVFKTNAKKYVLTLLLQTALCAVLCAVCVLACSFIQFNSLIATIVLRLVVCAIVPNVAMFVIFRKTNEFKGLVSMANSLTKGKIKILKKLM